MQHTYTQMERGIIGEVNAICEELYSLLSDWQLAG